jgi:mannose-6-phosphate isomerase-like protein (cupin superfamily)
VHFKEMRLPARPDVIAPDGSDVRVLLATERGSMAHFTLAPGACTHAMEHRTVDEIWYVVGGSGEIWRRHEDEERVVPLVPGACITIPVGTEFQFRAGARSGAEPLQIIGVTMPPWPGADEAAPVAGPWTATVGRGAST